MTVFLRSLFVHKTNEVDQHLWIFWYSFVRPLGVVKLLHSSRLTALHVDTKTNYSFKNSVQLFFYRCFSQCPHVVLPVNGE